MDVSISPLTHDLIVQLAREQAELRIPMQHDFEPRSTAALTFEHHYIARQRELEEQEG